MGTQTHYTIRASKQDVSLQTFWQQQLFLITSSFDAVSTLKITSEELYMRKLEMVICTDSKYRFDLRKGTTSPM